MIPPFIFYPYHVLGPPVSFDQSFDSILEPDDVISVVVVLFMKVAILQIISPRRLMNREMRYDSSSPEYHVSPFLVDLLSGYVQ